jgi:hypothetical protein
MIPFPSPRRERSSRRLCALLVALCASLAATALTPAAAAAQESESPTPTYAYYYIWYEHSSWDRAKSDYPLLGRYSSDDAGVMRRHVEDAQRAGIDGFIVSWKSTDVLNPRLRRLAEIADRNDFGLAIIYQGLDFYREPLSETRVASDLEYFVQSYENHPAFLQLEHRPVVIWSGTWEFSLHEIEFVAERLGERVWLLASEKDEVGYARLAHLVDGNAYYWSSVDPYSTPGYGLKLVRMSEAVHERRGLWFAPAAPGFDSTLLGGERVIERRGGETLREEIGVALASSPDVLALISWNEFSENSHIEPSKNYGDEALRVLADLHAAAVPKPDSFDSDSPGRTGLSRTNINTLFGLAVVILTSVGIVAARQRGG